MGLKQYKAKRDFKRTKEPAGARPRERAKRQLHFVVQKHDASHLHYDFRLEMEGVLRSWAVPKGFPFIRGDRRLAVEVEDHPIEYGGFEGTIPEGNYGAGTVMLWDRGRYAVLGEDPVQAWRDGKIQLHLEGKKLRGKWTLVRMRQRDASKPQWLLLKSETDASALSSKTEDQSVLTKRSMAQIAGASRQHEWKSNRMHRAQPERLRLPRSTSARTPSRPRSQIRHGKTRSVPASEAQSVRARRLELAKLPSRTAEFVDPMKAQLVGTLPKGEGWLYEIKFDGVRALAIKSGESVALISRSGKDLGGKYPEILDGIHRIPARQIVLDGEVVAVDAAGRSAFQLLQSYQSAGANKPPLFYYVFDVIQLDGKDLTGWGLSKRKSVAQQIVVGLPPMRFSGNIEAGSARVRRQMQARGLEGLIAKKRGSLYEPGRRSGAWVKFKWTNEQEFVIGGYTQPKGGRSHFGAILVGYYEGEQFRFAAKVGTGFNDEALRTLHRRFANLVQPNCPFANLPERAGGRSAGLGSAEMRRCTWLKPDLVCQVRFAEWTRDHHLRQPAYLGLREDKRAREVHREIPK